MNGTPVLRHLPNVFRRAGETGAAWRLLETVGTRFPGLERATMQVLASRYLDHAEYLEDLERLAAPWGIAPWPGEKLAAFRERLRALIPLYLAGQATLQGLLDLVGAAADADRVGPPTLPGLPLPTGSFTWPSEATERPGDPYTICARFQPRSGAPQFEAAVVELPLRWEGPVRIPPDGDWTLINQSYADPGPYTPDGHRLPHRFPDPVVEIAAGPAPVALPVLAQLDVGKLLLINRFLPPGAALAVDLEQMALTDLPGPVSLQGPLAADDLLIGSADFLGEPLPGKTVTWAKAERGAVPWLPFGLSRWRLLLGTDLAGRPPVFGGAPVPLALIRLVPAWEGNLKLPAPRGVQVRWRGRRPGTFTILFRPAGTLAWQATGPLLQPAWFREQVERLKPAGTLYLDPATTAEVKQPQAGAGSVQLSLWEEIPAAGRVTAHLTRVDRTAAAEERLTLTDTVTFTITRPEGKA